MIDRRKFLEKGFKTGLTTAVLSYMPKLAFGLPDKTGMGVAIGSGKYKTKSGETKFILTLFNLDSQKKRPEFIPVDFFIHGITVHPKNPYIIACFEKRGPGACEINLKTRKVTKKIIASKNHYFYGHGVYSKEGDELFITEAHLNNKNGIISTRDFKEYSVLSEFPTYGKNPHDCLLIDNGKVLAITNGGGTRKSKDKPCVSYVNIKEKKLLEKIEIEKEDINAGHLSVSPTNDLVIVSAPRDGLDKNLPGAISFRPNGKKLTTSLGPQKIISQMKSETLSLALVKDRNLVAATSPLGNMISFWNYKTAKFIKAVKIINPRSIGVSLDSNFFVVGHGSDARLSVINAKTFEIEKGMEFGPSGFSGSHLIIWNKPS